MTFMNIILEGDNAWPDLRELPEEKFHHVNGVDAVAVLNAGMTSGRPSVAFRINLPDGSVVIAETSGRMFVTAARAIAARYPDLFDDDPVKH